MEPPKMRSSSNHHYNVSHNYYKSENSTTYRAVTPSKQTVYLPLQNIDIQEEYYSYRTAPQGIREYVLQPSNFRGKYTKNPLATIVTYNSQ